MIVRIREKRSCTNFQPGPVRAEPVEARTGGVRAALRQACHEHRSFLRQAQDERCRRAQGERLRGTICSCHCLTALIPVEFVYEMYGTPPKDGISLAQQFAIRNACRRIRPLPQRSRPRVECLRSLFLPDTDHRTSWHYLNNPNYVDSSVKWRYDMFRFKLTLKAFFLLCSCMSQMFFAALL